MLTLGDWITTQMPPSPRTTADAKAARTDTAGQTGDPAVGTDAADQHVQLSQAGRELTTTMEILVEEGDENIPQELRPMMKMTRELKKRIKERLRELQGAMRSSDPGTKEARVSELQRELQQFNPVLQTATAAVTSIIEEMGINDPALIMKVMGSR